MAEAARAELVQDILANVSERRVAEVVPERNGFGKVLVEIEGSSDGAGDLGDLERVSQAGGEVIALGRDEDLGLML